MSTLAQRISDLITQIGADIKSLNTRVNAITPGDQFVAADYGYKSQAYELHIGASNTALPVNGTIYTVRLRLPAAATITNVVFAIGTAGASLTTGQNFVALYKATDKTLIAVSADQTTLWSSTGIKTAALVGGPYALPAGDYYAVIWSNGTTRPALVRSASNAMLNGSMVGGSPKFGSANTSITTTAPGTLGSISNLTYAYWAALS